jgi:hypothetical protein
MSSIPPEPTSPQGARDAGRLPSVSPDQNLPPVEPPSAGFLLQLFVVPAVIVACVVLVWFTIESLARCGEQDPTAIVRGLRGSNGFQQAKDLADMLATPQRYSLNTNRELAKGLATYLDELVEAGGDDDGSMKMRYFLASALGQFQLDDGLPALVNAARKDPDQAVRRRALNAISALAGGLRGLDPPQYLASEDLNEVLLESARDEDQLVRSETAFAIGVIAAAPEADSRLIDALVELADDPYTDARFNAAPALARLGNPVAPKAVAEMLDLEAIAASVSGEKRITEDQTNVSLRSQQARKRDMIVHNALGAIDALLKQKTSPDALEPLETALAKFVAAAPQVQDPAPIPNEMVDVAKKTLARVRAARP